jgi:surfeit locus 1 family protein
MRTSERRRPGPLTHLVVLAALALLVTLGVWQLHRLAWKEDIVERVAALQAAPAAPLEDALRRLADGEDVEFLRVVADCPGLDRARYLRLMTIRDRVAGFRAVSACRVADAPFAAVLVDRGFVADADAARLPQAEGDDEGHRPVVGILRRPDPSTFVTPANRPADNAWYSRDPAAMAEALGAGRVAPLLLFLESPPPAGFGPTPAPLPVEISNNHLGYALTWFGLAAALAGVYAAFWYRGRRV